MLGTKLSQELIPNTTQPQTPSPVKCLILLQCQIVLQCTIVLPRPKLKQLQTWCNAAGKFMNFQELICIYLSWVGLPLPANFQPKQPMDHGCGSFPEDMVLLLDTWVSVPQLLYHKIFPKMYWFSCAEPGTTSLRPFKVLSSNLCINLPGWIPMSLISFMLRQPRVGVLNENTGPFRGGCGPLCQISAQESNVVAAYCTQTHNQAPMQTVPFIK